jgi:hypothetical protein
LSLGVGENTSETGADESIVQAKQGRCCAVAIYQAAIRVGDDHSEPRASRQHGSAQRLVKHGGSRAHDPVAGTDLADCA